LALAPSDEVTGELLAAQWELLQQLVRRPMYHDDAQAKLELALPSIDGDAEQLEQDGGLRLWGGRIQSSAVARMS
jgi:hypothetical protein